MAPFIIQWGIIGCGGEQLRSSETESRLTGLGISGSFVRDLALPTSERDASDVAHVIAAVGSRDVAKAEKFIKDNCPEGGHAQKEGMSKIKTSAKGSYKECVEDPVGRDSNRCWARAYMLGRMFRRYISGHLTRPTMTTASSFLKRESIVCWRR